LFKKVVSILLFDIHLLSDDYDLYFNSLGTQNACARKWIILKAKFYEQLVFVE